MRRRSIRIPTPKIPFHTHRLPVVRRNPGGGFVRMSSSEALASSLASERARVAELQQLVLDEELNDSVYQAGQKMKEEEKAAAAAAAAALAAAKSKGKGKGKDGKGKGKDGYGGSKGSGKGTSKVLADTCSDRGVKGHWKEDCW